MNYSNSQRDGVILYFTALLFGAYITPREIRYQFKLMLEDRYIDICAYNLETVFAEKLETIITRATTNTRMRDFYDIYVLNQLHGDSLDQQILCNALIATSHYRGSEAYIGDAYSVIYEIWKDTNMQNLWKNYQKKFSYASEINWDDIINTIFTVLKPLLPTVESKDRDFKLPTTIKALHL